MKLETIFKTFLQLLKLQTLLLTLISINIESFLKS